MAEKKKLKNGFTTGTCSAVSAKAATLWLFGEKNSKTLIMTPKGIELNLEVLYKEIGDNYAICSIFKDSGDDPDVTNGMEIIVKVELNNSIEWNNSQGNDVVQRIELKAGEGVGTVTIEGLSCEVGQPAINPVPREMIISEVIAVLEDHDFPGGATVTISIPDGEKVAKRTFNPKLGVVGGLSILGTSGIVEAMSEKALIDSIKVEMDVRKVAGHNYLVVTPGNYGEKFIKTIFFDELRKQNGFSEKFAELEQYNIEQIDLEYVGCSNYIGAILDYAEELEFQGVLFVAHMGKLSKVAAGVMNTHSAYADGRMEVLSVYSVLCGGDKNLVEKIMDSITVDKAYEEIIELGIWPSVSKMIMNKVKEKMEFRTHHTMEIASVMFSNKHGLLGYTENTNEILEKIIKERI